MIKTDKPIIVEGKYDKITLENVIDAVIIPTNGFGIFKDKEKKELIRKLAQKSGLIVLTDSDRAGAQIRAYLKNICSGCEIINVYIPQLPGKERRKTVAGKDGLLGVEGMDEATLAEAFSRAGVNTRQIPERAPKITKQTLFSLGLSGRENSALLRNSLSEFLGIPRGMSSSGFVDAVNSLFNFEEFERQVCLWRQEADKK